MNSGAVRLTIEGGVATIVIDRPDARNAMTLAMYDELSRACETIAAAKGLRAAVLGHERAEVAPPVDE